MMDSQKVTSHFTILVKKMFLGLSIPKAPCNIGLSDDTYPKNIILNSI